MGSPTLPDFRDLAITDLADEGAQLRDALATVSGERDVFREPAQQAIHQLHDAHRQRQQHDRLADEYQRLRAQIMTKAFAA